jgi:hypothetical protein
MSHSFTIYPDDALIIVILENKISIDELDEIGIAVTAHSDYKHTFNGVYDFRNAIKTFSPQDIKMKFFHSKNKWSNKHGRWCSLNSTPLETALSELYRLDIQHYYPFNLF